MNPRPKRAEVRAKPAIGLVVEGATEFVALPLLHTKGLVPGCPPLRAINLGGVSAEMKPVGIAKRASKHVIAHILAERTTVVLCLDREDREACAGAFAQEVHRAVAAEIAATSAKASKAPYTLHVVVADRAFEAWILADALGLHKSKVFPRAPTFHGFEGELGKKQQKGVVEIEELWEREYLKAKHGPELFAKLRFPEARRFGKGKRGSRSLDKLLRCLGV